MANNSRRAEGGPASDTRRRRNEPAARTEPSSRKGSRSVKESFFDLAQRYASIRQSGALASKKPIPPPLPEPRERRLTDLPPPPAVQEPEHFADATDEQTLVQPVSRNRSEPPPAESERAPFLLVRPPPPPEVLPRLQPSTIPPANLRVLPQIVAAQSAAPPPVALATTVPPGPPVGHSFWLPMLAAAALSATIGAFVSAGLWAVRVAPAGSAKPLAAAVDTVPPRSTTAALPCPIKPSFGGPTSEANASNGAASNTTGSGSSTETHSSSGTTPQVSIDNLPLEGHGSAARQAALVSARPAAVVTARASAPTTTRADRAAARAERASRARADVPPPAPTEGPDRAAIAKSMSRAAAAASSCDSSPQSGKVSILFAPSGNVQSMQLVQGFGDSGVNSCVLRAFGRAHIPPFAGSPVEVRKPVSW
jgi:hypothetical protein